MGQTDFRFGGASGVAVAKSKAASVDEAVAELAAQLPSDELALILVFLSPSYDPHHFIAEITRQFDETQVCGCTTAGELAPDGWDENSVVALAFSRADFSAAVRPILNLDSFRVEDGRRIGGELRQELLRITPQVDRGNPFGLVLIDGLCRREEAVMSAIYASLDDIPVVGGSAGDGMRFEKTWVFCDGKAHTNAALLILLNTSLPFRAFKCDNFEPSPQKMVVTEADIENRTVRELNAEPAAEEYSRMVGILDAKLDPFSFASHPVLVRVGGAYYARSIQRVEPDGSLHFFCAIDEGMVLTAATSRSLVGSTRDTFAEIRDQIGDVSLYIGFECLLRRLDAEQHQLARDMSDLWLSYLWRAVRLHACEPDLHRRCDRKAPVVTDMLQGPDAVDQLRREAAKLKKINAALMSRVERSMDQQLNAFSLFETAIALDHKVRDRTHQLREALHSVERANEGLYRAKQQAEAASSLKSSVLISVTHDLLQPLNAARLTLSALTEMMESQEAGLLIDQADRSLLMLEDLLRSLLEIAKLDAGALKPDVRAIALAPLFEQLRNEFEPVAARQGLSLRIRASPRAVRSDAMMLRRILQNLLANAIRYTRNGGVVMGCWLRGDHICIQVSDTGPGIAQAQQQAIFREFQRGEATATDQAGFGLGLSIVRRFATVLGHEVRLSSQVGRGSTFTLELEPADLAEVSDEVHEVKLAERRYSGLEGAKILLIENDPNGSEAMAALLEGWGCDVATTRSAADALLRLSELGGAPDAVIADLHLDHGESGLSAIADVRQHLKLDTPAMIITADYSEKAAKDASRHGLEVLKKPIKPAEMRALLSFLLS
ncbi:CheY-like chemotaxis protein/anti-sigma regulatory factor (Ser/Thr protein kinase) [Bradyrhizobium diazoefficiens]